MHMNIYTLFLSNMAGFKMRKIVSANDRSA